ncbi:MAG: ImmA/IrrE family metallo-endopeptidase [Gemmatimonadaceae bacterium]|nr:ImmA/IrrE family metallo-endopeptidase [Gemmatimonadaceae bacterium]
MTVAPIKPELLTWARERAGLPRKALERKFPRLAAWEAGSAQPTLRQVERFARAVYVPVGYLFLPEPPVERLPIPDFRVGHGDRRPPSPNLFDTIYMCQGRQEWYRDYALAAGEAERDFVGSLSLATPVAEAAGTIRDALGFDLEARRACPTWTEALRTFIAQAEEIGVLVMVSGVVYNNTRRRLDPAEFRGFAIADRLAPLIFINGADTKAAQMFTLAHELGHLWLGQSALTDATPASAADGDVETWCNRVAAELLVPEAVLAREIDHREPLDEALARHARRFKVSTLVILRRLRDLRVLTANEFRAAYEAELNRLLSIDRGSGGNFHLTEAVRVSKRFASALVASTLEGHTLYRDAMQMLGISKLETFDRFSRHVQTVA